MLSKHYKSRKLKDEKYMSLKLTWKEKILSWMPEMAEITRLKALLSLVQGLSDMQIAQIDYYFQELLQAAWFNMRNRNLCNLIMLIGILYALLLFPLMNVLHLNEALRTTITQISLLVGFGGVPLLLKWTRRDKFGKDYSERKWALAHTFERFLHHLEQNKPVAEAYSLWYTEAYKVKQDSDNKIKKDRSEFFGEIGHFHLDKE
jgi:hypothetical protein